VDLGTAEVILQMNTVTLPASSPRVARIYIVLLDSLKKDLVGDADCAIQGADTVTATMSGRQFGDLIGNHHARTIAAVEAISSNRGPASPAQAPPRR
jgi:hypothetical protein